MKADVETRRAGSGDLPAILELAHRSLGWAGSDDDAAFFRWKHLANPLGESPMWVAVDGERVVGFRTFLRWQFRGPDGEVVLAVRAVDTATDPDYQGRGVFTRLTLDALEELRADGVRLIFNTPNERSRPGYLKMGWSVVGRVPTAVMLTKVGSMAALAKARQPATRWSIDSNVGDPALDVLTDGDAVARLLKACPRADGLATERTPTFLAWRYGFEPLRYRAVLAGSSPADGLLVFRLRRRGRAVEAAVCESLIPRADARTARSLLREVARASGADYLVRLEPSWLSPGPFMRLPRTGPVLTCKRLDGAAILPLRQWRLTLGDVELF